ncbi:hypothetical protein COO60DRAFT_1644820 [Scenedesmus sp. NREL 46B-D3]|nr:hypothetical protein COO60DRAFT_1644820 [Scenedesmus sp. NREL 46B-D3]
MDAAKSNATHYDAYSKTLASFIDCFPLLSDHHTYVMCDAKAMLVDTFSLSGVEASHMIFQAAGDNAATHVGQAREGGAEEDAKGAAAAMKYVAIRRALISDAVAEREWEREREADEAREAAELRCLEVLEELSDES